MAQCWPSKSFFNVKNRPHSEFLFIEEYKGDQVLNRTIFLYFVTKNGPNYWLSILKRPKGQKYFYGCFQSSLALCTKPYYSPLNSGAYRKITSGTLNQKSWHKCKPFLCNSCAITYSFVFRISPPPIKYLWEINFFVNSLSQIDFHSFRCPSHFLFSNYFIVFLPCFQHIF